MDGEGNGSSGDFFIEYYATDEQKWLWKKAENISPARHSRGHITSPVRLVRLMATSPMQLVFLVAISPVRLHILVAISPVRLG
jgi:hypothetical protein